MPIICILWLQPQSVIGRDASHRASDGGAVDARARSHNAFHIISIHNILSAWPHMHISAARLTAAAVVEFRLIFLFWW